MKRALHLTLWTSMLFGPVLATESTATSTPNPTPTQIQVLSERLAAARLRYETAAAELEAARLAQKEELAVFVRRKSEQDAERLRLQAMTKELEKRLASEQEAVAALAAPAQHNSARLQEVIAAHRQRVSAGSPFRQEQRLARLDQLSRLASQGRLQDSINGLSTFVEDEARLARSYGVARQSLHFASGDRLVDVVHVGLVALYYRSTTEVGAVRINDAGLATAAPFTDAAQTAAAFRLFEAVEQQPESPGALTLPSVTLQPAIAHNP